MKCKDIKKLLSPYQDREITENISNRITAHLKACRHCKQELKSLEQIIYELKNLADIEPESSFNARIMERLKKVKRSTVFPLPSIVYSLIFVIFFTLGFIINSILDNGNQQKLKKPSVVNLLLENQDLSLINVQDKTIKILYKGVTNEK